MSDDQQRRIEYLSIDELVPADQNAKEHEGPVVQASINRFGYTSAIEIDERTGKMVAGHGRLQALKTMRDDGQTPPDGISHDWRAPVLRGWSSKSDEEALAYGIAANQTTIIGGWDNKELLESLNRLDDLDGLGFTLDELNELAAEITELPPTPATDPDHIPESSDKPITKRGDVWRLGSHRIMCGDSTDEDDVLTLMGEVQGVQTLHADPPYGMGKEADGVENDNLYREKLDAFQMEWWKAWRPYLADNASAYLWGNAPDLWRLWYSRGLGSSESMTLRNEIVWDKGNGFGISSAEMRSYSVATERCLFFVLGEQGFNNDATNYWEGWEPVRRWLSEERERSGLTTDDCNRICGKQNMTQSAFTKGGFRLILQTDYEALRDACNGSAFARPFKELKTEYDKLKMVFDASKAFFNNTHDNMTDVWQFPRVHGEDRHGHATPKPVAMIERAIKSTCPVGGYVAEPFAGSGSTLMAAHGVGASCLTMEITPKYVDTVCKRFEAHTGVVPILDSTGEAISFLGERVTTTREA